MKNKTTAPEKRIVISIIGWVIELIIDAIQRRKDTAQKNVQ